MNTFEDNVQQQLLDELKYFDDANLSDPSVFTAMNSTTMMILVDIQDDHPQFDAKAQFVYDPEPEVTVTWWVGMQGEQKSFRIKFNPVRIDTEQEDLISAYERAMSIL